MVKAFMRMQEVSLTIPSFCYSMLAVTTNRYILAGKLQNFAKQKMTLSA